jgi:ketosteroid isomerase-like protein
VAAAKIPTVATFMRRGVSQVSWRAWSHERAPVAPAIAAIAQAAHMPETVTAEHGERKSLLRRLGTGESPQDMSRQNVDLHRRVYDAFNHADLEGLVTLCAPDIEVESVFSAVGGAVYRGHDGLAKWLSDLREAWGDELRVEAEAYYDLGDRVLAFDVMYGRGRQSGAGVALPGAALTTWREGLCVSFKAYDGREQVLRDLAITVSELEPIDL